MPKETFEEALKKLEAIIEKLEDGDLPLERSLEAFEEGVKLSRYCSKKLEEAQEKVELLLENESGNLTTEPFRPSRESASPKRKGKKR